MNRFTTELVRRQRLIDMIELPFLARVTVIVAPAGYEKTTLAHQWTIQTTLPVRWISAPNSNGRPLAETIRDLTSDRHRTGIGNQQDGTHSAAFHETNSHRNTALLVWA